MMNKQTGARVSTVAHIKRKESAKQAFVEPYQSRYYSSSSSSSSTSSIDFPFSSSSFLLLQFAFLPLSPLPLFFGCCEQASPFVVYPSSPEIRENRSKILFSPSAPYAAEPINPAHVIAYTTAPFC